VPVKAANSAFGNAARMFIASVSYWLLCALSANSAAHARQDVGAFDSAT